MSFKSGFVAITGRPNMGKSTFLNRVLGQKVAIVTPKAQTTRTRILGVRHLPEGQMVFIDTPGIHDHGRNLLNRAMVQVALDACREVDLVLYFVEAAHGLLPEDWEILARLPRGDAPVILVFNQVDRVNHDELLPRVAAAAEGAFTFAEVVPISALNGTNVERLLKVITGYLPEGPAYFPEDQVTDQPERFIAGEMIRERLFYSLQKELPYTTGVHIESFREEEGLITLNATILVERESQKGIVIGRQGEMLKRIGSEARHNLERFFGVKVFLKLWVKVSRGWTENRRTLEELGYPVDPDRGAS